MAQVKKKDQYQIVIEDFYADNCQGRASKDDLSLALNVIGGALISDSGCGVQGKTTVAQAKLLIEALQLFIDTESPVVDTRRTDEDVPF